MPEPICRAQSQVQSSELSRVQAEARKKFTVAEAVRDDEILPTADWRKRLEFVSAKLGEVWDSERIIRNILAPLRAPEMPQFRTYTNVFRLVRSTRINDERLVQWLKLASNPDELDKFRETSQQILLGARLFYYDFIPHQGSAWCFMPLSNPSR
jgi:hypothetical protein